MQHLRSKHAVGSSDPVETDREESGNDAGQHRADPENDRKPGEIRERGRRGPGSRQQKQRSYCDSASVPGLK